MPLTKIQTDILRLLAAHRDPESYVAGASPLNRDAPRISGDIDVFHDREDDYPTHAGQRRGHWPSSPEIAAVMFERYNQKPSP